MKLTEIGRGAMQNHDVRVSLACDYDDGCTTVAKKPRNGRLPMEQDPIGETKDHAWLGR